MPLLADQSALISQLGEPAGKGFAGRPLWTLSPQSQLCTSSLVVCTCTSFARSFVLGVASAIGRSFTLPTDLADVLWLSRAKGRWILVSIRAQEMTLGVRENATGSFGPG